MLARASLPRRRSLRLGSWPSLPVTATTPASAEPSTRARAAAPSASSRLEASDAEDLIERDPDRPPARRCLGGHAHQPRDLRGSLGRRSALGRSSGGVSPRMREKLDLAGARPSVAPEAGRCWNMTPSPPRHLPHASSPVRPAMPPASRRHSVAPFTARPPPHPRPPGVVLPGRAFTWEVNHRGRTRPVHAPDLDWSRFALDPDPRRAGLEISPAVAGQC